jgi:tetratricopeptide (TPR) repeat protein
MPADDLFVVASIKSRAVWSAIVLAMFLCRHVASAAEAVVDLRAAILASHSGETLVDDEIRRLQAKVQVSAEANPIVVSLGWAFVAKARLTSDPGFYKLAEQCAQLGGEDSASLQLRGHVFHALHRFKEAGSVARKLIRDRVPRWENYALLGDALMEQGKLAESVDAYQHMIDIRPCLQTYARVAHVRWLKGDVPGAEELMKMAVSAGNSRDPEPAAWAYTRLASYQFQLGNAAGAEQSLRRGAEFVKDYPAALFLQSKIDIANGNFAKALSALRLAAAQVPLPEYEWALADAARLTADDALAATTESELLKRGAAADERSYALFLADRGLKPDVAVKLAESELANRRDVFTYDALGWANLAAGRNSTAKETMERALAEGTLDARLFYHAGKIAAATGDAATARKWFERAAAIKQMLQPSEQAELLRQLKVIQSVNTITATVLSRNLNWPEKAEIRKNQ